MMRAVAVFCTVLATGVASAAGPVHNALLGKWQADIAHSTFVGRAPYRTGSMTISREADSLVHVVADVVTASGAPFHFEYTSNDQGGLAPVTGNPYYNEASTTWTDAHTAVRSEFRAGKEIGKTIMVVAKDGKSYTASSKRTTPEDGHLYTSVIVWRRAM